jgi:hypothetical protein
MLVLSEQDFAELNALLEDCRHREASRIILFFNTKLEAKAKAEAEAVQAAIREKVGDAIKNNPNPEKVAALTPRTS